MSIVTKLGLVEQFKNKGKNQLSVQVVPRPPKDPSKVKSKNIKVSEECHRLIGSNGKVKEDFGDIVERAMRHYVSCPHIKDEEEAAAATAAAAAIEKEEEEQRHD